MDIKEKFQVAISMADTVDKLLYVKQKLLSTSQINRRTKEGRALTARIEEACRLRLIELANNGESPFD